MKKHFVILSIIPIVFIINVFVINKANYGFEERWTLCNAKGLVYHTNSFTSSSITNQDIDKHNTIKNVFHATAQSNGNNLIYNFFLHYWMKLFGESQTSTRMLSQLSLLFLIIVVYKTAFLLSNNAIISSITAIITTTNPVIISYSLQNRAYIFSAFFCVLSTYFLFKFFFNKHNRTTYFYYLSSVFICLFSHFSSIYIIIGHAILLFNYSRKIKILFPFIIIYLTCTLVLCIWLLSFNNIAWTILNIHNIQLQNDYRILDGNTINIIISSIASLSSIFGMNVYLFTYVSRYEILTLSAFLIFVVMMFYKNTIISKKHKKLLVIPITIYVVYSIVQSFLTSHCYHFHLKYTTLVIPISSIILSFIFYENFIKYSLVSLRNLYTIVFSIIIVSSMVIVYNGYLFTPKKNKLSSQRNVYAYNSKLIQEKYAENTLIVCPDISDIYMLSGLLPKNKLYTFVIDPTLKDEILLKDSKNDIIFSLPHVIEFKFGI